MWSCNRIALALLITTFLWRSSSGGDGTVSSNISCHGNERRALLKFRASLNDSFNHLASWGEDPDCCKWEGVVCHNQTRYVLQLKLASPHRFYVGFEQTSSNNYWGLSGELNPALLELEQLQDLDLSYNDFKGIQIPTFLGSLKELKYLSLSSANFGGEIPYQLGNLSKLVFLDISRGDHVNAILRSRGLDWLKGMPSLNYLNLDLVDLSKTGVSWEHTLNHFTSLIELHLHSCGLPRLVTYLTSPLCEYSTWARIQLGNFRNG